MKNPTKQKKHRFKHFLVYLATYIAVTFTMAFVVVSFSDKTFSANNVRQPSPPTKMELLLNNFLTLQDADMDLNLSVSQDNMDLNIVGDINLAMDAGFSNIRLSLDALVNYNAEKFDVSISYVDNMLYASINNMAYAMNTASLSDGLAVVMGLMGVNMDAMGGLMDSLDPSQFSSLEEDITEKIEGDTIYLTLPVTDGIEVEIVTDKDYTIKDVNLNSIAFAGFELGGNIGFESLNTGLEVTKPEKDFVDVSPLVDVVLALTNTVTERFEISTEIEDVEITSVVDLQNMAVRASLNVLGHEVSLTYLNDTAYLDTEIIDIKTENVSRSLIALISQIINSDALSKIEIDSNAFVLPTISTEKIGNATIIDINGERLVVEVVAEKISKITLGDLEVDFNYDEVLEIQVNDDNYINIVDFEPIVEPVKKILEDKSVSFDILAFEQKLSAKLDFENTLKAEINTNILGVNLNINYQDEHFYISLGDLKYVIDFNDINEVLKFVDSIKDTDLELPKDELSFDRKDNVINMGFGGFDCSFETNKDDIVDLTLSKGKTQVKLINFVTGNRVQVVDNSQFENLEITQESLQAIYDYIRGMQFALKGSVTYKDVAVDVLANIDMANDIHNLNVKVLDKELNIFIENSDIFVNFEGQKVRGNLNDLGGIMALLSNAKLPTINYFNIEKITKVDGNVVVSLNIDGEIIDITISDKITATFGDLVIDLQKLPFEEREALSDSAKLEYKAEISHLLNLVRSGYNTLNSKYIAGKIVVNEYVVNFTMVNDEGLTIRFDTEVMGYKIKGYIVDNTLYLNAFDVCFELTITEQLITELKSMIDLPEIDVLDCVMGIDLGVIQELSTTNNSLHMNMYDFDVDIYHISDKISSLFVSGENIDAKITLNYPTYNAIKIKNDRIIKLDSVLPFVKAIKNSITDGVSGSLNINGIKVNYALDYSNGLNAKLDTIINGEYYALTLIDDTVYADIAGIKAQVEVSEIASLLAVISEKIDLNLDINIDFDFNNLSLAFIDYFDLSDDHFKMTIFEDLTLEVYYSDRLESIGFEKGEICVVAEFDSFENVKIEPVNEEEYNLKASQLIDLVNSILNTTKEKYIKGTIDLKIAPLEKIYFTFVNGEAKSLYFNTTFQNIAINGYFEGQTLYIEVQGLILAVDITEEVVARLMTLIPEANLGEMAGVLTLDDLTSLYTSDNGLHVSFAGYNVDVLHKDNKLSKLILNSTVINGEISLDYPATLEESFDTTNALKIDYPIELIDAIINSLSGEIQGQINLQFDFMKETHEVIADYGVKYSKEGIDVYFNTTFKDQTVSLRLHNTTLYADIVGIKFQLPLNELSTLTDWINSKFGTDFNIDTNKKLEDIKLDFVDSLKVEAGRLQTTLFENATIDAYFGDKFSTVYFNYGKVFATLHCDNYNEFELAPIVDEEYQHFTNILEVADSVLALISDTRYSVTAKVDMINNGTKTDTIDASVKIDDFKKISANVASTNSKINNIFIGLQQQYYYINYQGLKLSIHQSKLKEIIGIGLGALGIDASSLGLFDLVTDDMQIDFSNITEVMPNIDLGNPLNMLKYLSGMTLENNVLTISIKKSIIDSSNVGEFGIVINFTDSGVSTITINGIDIDANKSVNVSITFNDFDGVANIDDANSYHNISDSADLLRALVNTSSMDDFTIEGDVRVKLSLSSLNLEIPMDIPIYATVKVGEKDPVTGKTAKPEVYVKMNVPVIGASENVWLFGNINVNNDVPYKAPDGQVESRVLEIMYKDGFFYIYRIDKVQVSNRIYEKKLKVSEEEMFSDPLYYLLDYSFGFSDKIMGEIRKALEKSFNREKPIDMANVFMGYNRNLTTDAHEITINLGEIANNDMLKNVQVNFHTIKTAVNGGAEKDYIGHLTFDMQMQFIEGVQMNLFTDFLQEEKNSLSPLSLTNIGKEVDMTYLRNYVNSYTYGENQMWSAFNNSWSMDSEKEYVISFSSERGTVPESISAKIDSPIKLPSMESKIEESKSDGIYTYYFDGWYYDKELKHKADATINMPRGDSTLYAKWVPEVVYYRTLSFNMMGLGSTIISQTHLEGTTNIGLPSVTEKPYLSDTQNHSKTTYIFGGWYYDKDFNSPAGTVIAMPEYNLELFAKWNIESTVTAYNLTVLDNGVMVYDEYIQENIDIDLSSVTRDSNTRFYTDSAFNNPYTLGKMPSGNLTLYVRNKYTLTIYSGPNDTEMSTVSYYQGTPLTWNNLTKAMTNNDGGEQEYTFLGWSSTPAVMPNSDLTVKANWKVTEFFFITFDVSNRYSPVGCWGTYGYKTDPYVVGDKPLPPNNVLRVEKGTEVKLSEYVVRAELYCTAFKKSTKTYTSAGWSVNDPSMVNDSINASIVVTSSQTVYVVWDD